MKPSLSILLLLIFTACGSGKKADTEIPIRVNSYTVPCVGEAEGECLLIQKGTAIGTDDWEYFYFKDDIEGFDYEEGFTYDLVVEKKEVEAPPMDSSSEIYRLVRVESKEKQ